MTLPEFEELADKAVKLLPRRVKALMQNVAVTVAERPTKAQERRFGRGLLGLYEGVPLLERGAFYSGVMPDKITLFRKNIEAQCSGPKEIEAEVRHVILHEIAHHFGATDEELIRKDLY